jgi:hypothetical protein
MEKLNERKLERLFAPSYEEAWEIDARIREYSGDWWLRTSYNANCSAYLVNAGGAGSHGNVNTANIVARPAFFLNKEFYYGGELAIGDEIELPLNDGQKAKFIYACDVKGKKLMLAADDMLSRETKYGEYGDGYANSDLRKVMQETEKLLTPEALALMLPVEVRGNDVIAQAPALKNVRDVLNKLGKQDENAESIKAASEKVLN